MNRIIRIFLSLVIAISPVLIMNQANAAIGGWTLGNPVAQGASAVYDASKTVLINGKNVVKNSAITIAPTAANVAKVLARGGATLALTVAVEQLLGAVDWVLDPANNQIRYKDDSALNCKTQDCSPYSYLYGTSSSIANSTILANTPEAACAMRGSESRITNTSAPYSCSFISPSTGNRVNGYIYKIANPNYDQSAEEDREKTLPLEVVAQKVISNAESGDTNAQGATTAAAADIVNEAESDETKARPIAAELDKAASIATDESATGEATQTKTDPTTGQPVTETTDIALEFPTFCGWAPIVCEAAQVVISVPQAVAEAWATTKEWLFADDPLPDSEFVDISQLPTPELQENAISWAAQCPQDVHVPVNMQGVSSTITFSWSPWCQLLSIIKPAIIASAYIGAAFIVLGLRT